MSFQKVNLEGFRTCAAAWSVEDAKQKLEVLQVAVYVMCGGGLLGLFAAQQSGDFYIDMRVGRLPYTRREIMQAVGCLVEITRVLGLDVHKLPEMLRVVSCGIF